MRKPMPVGCHAALTCGPGLGRSSSSARGGRKPTEPDQAITSAEPISPRPAGASRTPSRSCGREDGGAQLCYGARVSRSSRISSLSVLVLGALVGCTDEPIGDRRDSGVFFNIDAGPDAGFDGGSPVMDGAVDASLPTDAAIDAAPDGGTEVDAGPGTDAGRDAGPFPANTFFIGNSFTFYGPVPTLVEELATFAGFDEFDAEYRAVGGRSLRWHREDTEAGNAVARVDEGWDLVVLQDYSTRPTDHPTQGDPTGFKEDAAWWFLRARDANPDVRVILYETWARRFNHSIYPDGYASPAVMQEQLRFHYYDAADSYLPSVVADLRSGDVRVAPVGDTWELQLLGGEPPKLHDTDDYHAGAAGQYLNALVLFATIFEMKTDELQPIGVDFATAMQLQQSCDDVTGFDSLSPFYGPRHVLASEEVLRFDLGPISEESWPGLIAPLSAVGPIAAVSGEATGVRSSAWAFSGDQEGGSSANDLGYPAGGSRDSFWVGSCEGHDAARSLAPARVTLWNVPEGSYEVALFASRDGDDEGRGRLTRYRVGGATQDLAVSDNRGVQAIFTGVRPDADGKITIEVSVSPAGGARFAYLGAVELRRE